MDQILLLVSAHKWIALAALVVGALMRLLKAGKLGAPMAKLPARWRPMVAVGLGTLAGVLDAGGNGTKWQVAVGGGVISAALAVMGHDVIVEGFMGGTEPASGMLDKTKNKPAPPPVGGDGDGNG